MKVRLHAMAARSRSNGPGQRAVLWFQGCSLACPGCFNPATHAPAGGFVGDSAALAADLRARAPTLDGVTLSGGEPLEQADAVLDLLRRLAPSRLGTLLFTGFTRQEVEAQPWGGAIFEHLDAAVCGRYEAPRHLGRGLLGSSNQEIVLLSQRYRAEDFARVPPTEVILSGGTATVSGVRPLSLARRLTAR